MRNTIQVQGACLQIWELFSKINNVIKTRHAVADPEFFKRGGRPRKGGSISKVATNFSHFELKS
jgi:hypothetical protein